MQCAARGEPLGAAHGLPVVVKDVMKVAGLACSGGSRALRAVARRRRDGGREAAGAGAIVLGLTNVPELGRGAESNNSLYGRTNNPYDLTRTPGGSSGGSAALVAAGGAALSVGTDEGGSIRQPSHNTGIAGLKPSHGRIPRTGNVFGNAPGIFGPFSHYGPLARSVADLVPGPVDHERTRSARSVRGARAHSAIPMRSTLPRCASPPTSTTASRRPPTRWPPWLPRRPTRWGRWPRLVQHATPGCLGRTMELLWTSVFLGGDRGREFEEVLRALGVTDPSEELAEFLTQASKVEFSLTEARQPPRRPRSVPRRNAVVHGRLRRHRLPRDAHSGQTASSRPGGRSTTSRI